jgi:hypothetical protein
VVRFVPDLRELCEFTRGILGCGVGVICYLAVGKVAARGGLLACWDEQGWYERLLRDVPKAAPLPLWGD